MEIELVRIMLKSSSGPSLMNAFMQQQKCCKATVIILDFKGMFSIILYGGGVFYVCSLM